MHVKMNQSLKQQLPSDINYLLILGSTLKTNEMTQTLRSRLEKGARITKKTPTFKGSGDGWKKEANFY